MYSLHTSSEIRTARSDVSDLAVFLCTIRKIAASCDTHIICFNADMIAGRVHAAAAVERAIRALETGSMISNTLEMEALLYAAGTRQCNVAASFGIHAGENRMFVCCYPQRTHVWESLEPLFQFTDESWDDIDQEKRDRLKGLFGISNEEITAAGGVHRLVDLVLERVALLQVTK